MSYKRFRDDIPTSVVDDIYKNQDYHRRNVYRAISHNVITTVKEDFLPSFMDLEYIPLILTTGHYGLSVFEDLEKLKNTVASSKRLYNSTIGYAFGFTNFDRGIWTNPDNKTHINYFLFDWDNNNPFDDFEIIEAL